jgi:hypothetical protein
MILPLSMAVGLLAYTAILLTGIWVGVEGTKNIPTIATAVMMMVAAGFALATDRLRPIWATAALVVAGFAIFGLALASIWRAGFSSDLLVIGLLPISDAGEYLKGALKLLTDGSYHSWAARRPLTAIYLAALLDLTGGDLRLVAAILTAGTAAATALVTAALSRAWGPAPAALAASVLLAAVLPTVGTLMSENVGFLFGGLGFVLMLEAVERERPGAYVVGLGLLGIGLVARAGAMFVLPVLGLWAGWWLRGQRPYAVKWAMIAAVAGLVPLALNPIANYLFGPASGGSFSNFSYVVYGLVSGGQPWQQVLQDIPGLGELHSSEHPQRIYAAAWAHFLMRPWDLLVGIAVRYNEFLLDTGWHKFIASETMRGIVLLFTLAGFYRLWTERRTALVSFLAWGFIGVLLSVPFIGDGGGRVRIATVAFTAALACLGVSYVVSRFRRTQGAVKETWGLGLTAAALAVLALGVFAAADPASRATTPTRPASSSAVTCTPPARSYHLRSAPGSYVDLAADGEGTDFGHYRLRFSHMRQARKWPVVAAEAIARAKPPFRIIWAFEPLDDNGSIWLLADPPIDPDWKFSVCGIRRDGLVHVVPGRR